MQDRLNNDDVMVTMQQLSAELNEDGFEMSLEVTAHGDEGSSERAVFEARLTGISYATMRLDQAFAALDLLKSIDELDDAVTAHAVAMAELDKVSDM